MTMECSQASAKTEHTRTEAAFDRLTRRSLGGDSAGGTDFSACELPIIDRTLQNTGSGLSALNWDF